MEFHAVPHPSKRRDKAMDNKITTRLRLVAVAAGLGIAADAASLEIVFSDLTPGTHSTQLIAGFEEAAALWELALLDPVTVRIDVAFQALDVGTTAAAGSSSNAYAFSDVRAALLADAASLDDGDAIGSLEDDSDFQFVIRDVNDASTLHYVFSEQSGVDAWNTTLDVNRANAKSLALLADDNMTDGTIVISNEVNFDFDRSDGITPGSVDFVGVAAHYIGHILGFASGVDAIDFVSTSDGQAAGCCNTIGSRRYTDLSRNSLFTVLDLYRYSVASQNTPQGPGIAPRFRDFTFGNLGAVYFSPDGGQSNLGGFSTGRFNGLGTGGGQSASHLENGLGLGLMAPVAAAGVLMTITALDLRALDTIGWDRPPSDNDGIPDITDNCPAIDNPGQENFDQDAEGDACDADDDNDGLSDAYELANNLDPFDVDTDDDGIGDALDSDPLIASNACTASDGLDATLQADVADERTCAARLTITVLPVTTVQPPGRLTLIAPRVVFQAGDVLGGLTVTNADPCPGCPSPD